MRDRDIPSKIRRKIIGLDDNEVESKLYQKYSKISHNTVEDLINHRESIHSMSLQRSDYVCVEPNKIKNLMMQDKS